MDAGTFSAMSGMALCLAVFLLPFVQEDVAVVTAATASLSGAAPTLAFYASVLAGLVLSDVWKYWLGYFARRNRWAHKFAEKPGVSVAGDLVRTELVKTLFAARYIPGTRIPTYVACGFFRTPYLRFVFLVVLTAFTYVTIMFALFHTVGAVAGASAKYWLPAIAVALVSGYVFSRWLKHRNNRMGPMTPLTKEFDHPMPGMPGFEGTPLEGEEDRREAAE
jgi:membrane protein DedA with SNARE-associated domain